VAVAFLFPTAALGVSEASAARQRRWLAVVV
jgi:hypothetical protein